MYQSCGINNPVTKLLKVHWHGWYVHIIFHEFPKWKVHGCQIGWSGWPWNVAATTYPLFRECLVQVQQSSRDLGDISHMKVWTVLRTRLSFRPYKFQLLQELKPNDRPHWRNFCTDILNCLKEYHLFLNKIVLSDKATFHLSGKDLQEIRNMIVNTKALVDANFLDKLWDKLEYRLDVCHITRGSHIEHS
jgi:hypothetical protein